jgi:hypothetical protein
MTPRDPRPPRLARRLVERRLRGERQELVLGDLDEAFADAIAAGDSPRRAARRYWRQALASAWPRRRQGAAPFTSCDTHASRHRTGAAHMWMHDLRYTGRLLKKSPIWTLAVVLTIALAIGANTAVFSVVNAVLLRPLPFSEPSRLVWIAERNDRLNLPVFAASILNYLSWKDGSRAFESMGALTFATFTLTGSGEPEQFAGGRLSASLLPLLGLQPVAGRGFVEDDERPGATRCGVIASIVTRRRSAARSCSTACRRPSSVLRLRRSRSCPAGTSGGR